MNNNILLPDSTGPRKIERRHCQDKMLVGTARLHGSILCPNCGYTEPIDSDDTKPKSKLTDSPETPMLVQANSDNKDNWDSDLPPGVKIVKSWEIKDGNYF